MGAVRPAPGAPTTLRVALWRRARRTSRELLRLRRRPARRGAERIPHLGGRGVAPWIGGCPSLLVGDLNCNLS
eukprot:14523985-Alexandrium_andersonii.AAC.1